MANIEKRVSLKGIESFRAKVRLKGFKYKSRTFAREVDAIEWATAFERNLKLKRANEDIEAGDNDSAQVVLCLPKKLADKLKSVASRGHRSQYIITLLENHFAVKKNDSDKVERQAVKRYASVSQMPSLYPAFTEGGIRHFIFHHEKFGFTKCFKRAGRKILIDLDAFELWLENSKQ